MASGSAPSEGSWWDFVPPYRFVPPYGCRVSAIPPRTNGTSVRLLPSLDGRSSPAIGLIWTLIVLNRISSLQPLSPRHGDVRVEVGPAGYNRLDGPAIPVP